MTTMMALTRSVMSRNTLFHHEVGCPLQTSPSGQQRLSRPEQAGDGDDQVDHDVGDQVGRNDGDQVGHDGNDDPVLTPTQCVKGGGARKMLQTAKTFVTKLVRYIEWIVDPL